MARFAVLLLLLSLGSACRERVDPVVADMARDWRRVPTSPGFRIASARGEGHTLILQIEVDADGAQVLDAATTANMLAAGICAIPRDANFFSEGRTLRIELFAPGRAATNAVVSRCTGPVGRGFTMDAIVAMFRPMVGRDLGDGGRMTSVRAEGQTLVMVLDGRPGWRTGLDQETIARAFLEDPCSPPGGFKLFNGTRSLRIDTTEGGGNLIQGQVITRCPAPPIGRP